jgi:hypothetical protein
VLPLDGRHRQRDGLRLLEAVAMRRLPCKNALVSSRFAL